MKLIAVSPATNNGGNFEIAVAHRYRHGHFGHERDEHADHDGHSTVTGGQHARRIEQLVADNLGDKDCAVSCEEDGDHLTEVLMAVHLAISEL